MTGLDKIINQIEEEAKSSADKIIEEANAQAQTILTEADSTCREIGEDAEKKAEAARQDILKKSSSASSMERKKELLSAKLQVIDRIIDQARESLYTQETDAYFELIERMIEKFARAASGEIRFCEKDKKRLPAGFEKKAAAAAAKKGGSLTVSKETCDIAGGFILVYGGIEENCSFEAMFAAERESLQDQVHTLLFS